MSEWSEEENDMLRKLYAEGKSFTQIGAAIGRTKGAAISRARKLKLPSRGPDHMRAQYARAARERWKNREPKPKREKKPFSLKRTTPRERKPPMFFRVVTAPDSVPVPLFERTGCCYPTTPHGPHLFCNEPITKSDYCEFHLSIMYPRRRAA